MPCSGERRITSDMVSEIQLLVFTEMPQRVRQWATYMYANTILQYEFPNCHRAKQPNTYELVADLIMWTLCEVIVMLLLLGHQVITIEVLGTEATMRCFYICSGICGF